MGKVQRQESVPHTREFERVWAILQRTAKHQEEAKREMEETRRQIKETREESRQEMREYNKRQEETRQQMKETRQQMKETDRQIKEYNRRFGDFTNRFGEMVEYMVAPNLQKKFRELGLNFPEVNQHTAVSDIDNQIFFEIDVFLENGDKAMLVEVKSKLTAGDVKEHIKRLEKMRVYSDLHGDKRAFLGAMAGVVMTPYVKKYALEQGFYVVEPSGETFAITKPNGKPKEW